MYTGKICCKESGNTREPLCEPSKTRCRNNVKKVSFSNEIINTWKVWMQIYLGLRTLMNIKQR